MAKQNNQFHIDFFADRVEPEAAGANQQALDHGIADVTFDAAIAQPAFEFDADPIDTVASNSNEQSDTSSDIEEALRDLEDEDSLVQFEIQ